jgi:hypothetical protein
LLVTPLKMSSVPRSLNDCIIDSFYHGYHAISITNCRRFCPTRMLTGTEQSERGVPDRSVLFDIIVLPALSV